MTAVLKRSAMTLFTDSSIDGHRVRFVLAIKGVNVEISEVDPSELPQALLEMSSEGILPTLIDRDLVLNQPNVIMEYLDERFPHPPLLPVYPVARAKSRLMIHQIEQDWYSLVDKMYHGSADEKKSSQKLFIDQMISLAPVFKEMPFFLSEELSLVDCTLAPMLWRLPEFGVVLPDAAQVVVEYADRLFELDAFKASLTETEQEIRESDDF